MKTNHSAWNEKKRRKTQTPCCLQILHLWLFAFFSRFVHFSHTQFSLNRFSVSLDQLLVKHCHVNTSRSVHTIFDIPFFFRSHSIFIQIWILAYDLCILYLHILSATTTPNGCVFEICARIKKIFKLFRSEFLFLKFCKEKKGKSFFP